MPLCCLSIYLPVLSLAVCLGHRHRTPQVQHNLILMNSIARSLFLSSQLALAVSVTQLKVTEKGVTVERLCRADWPAGVCVCVWDCLHC